MSTARWFGRSSPDPRCPASSSLTPVKSLALLVLTLAGVSPAAEPAPVSHNLNFVNGTGRDTHNQGQLKPHMLFEDPDQALSTLITDLHSLALLDKTLIVVNNEFGRPSAFDGGDGRGHQGSVFSVVLAGGGLRHHGAWGVTDAESKKSLEPPWFVPDLFATILAALQINPSKELHDGDRPVPITDRGQPVTALFGIAGISPKVCSPPLPP